MTLLPSLKFKRIKRLLKGSGKAKGKGKSRDAPVGSAALPSLGGATVASCKDEKIQRPSPESISAKSSGKQQKLSDKASDTKIISQGTCDGVVDEIIATSSNKLEVLGTKSTGSDEEAETTANSDETGTSKQEATSESIEDLTDPVAASDKASICKTEATVESIDEIPDATAIDLAMYGYEETPTRKSASLKGAEVKGRSASMPFNTVPMMETRKAHRCARSASLSHYPGAGLGSSQSFFGSASIPSPTRRSLSLTHGEKSSQPPFHSLLGGAASPTVMSPVSSGSTVGSLKVRASPRTIGKPLPIHEERAKPMPKYYEPLRDDARSSKVNAGGAGPRDDNSCDSFTGISVGDSTEDTDDDFDMIVEETADEVEQANRPLGFSTHGETSVGISSGHSSGLINLEDSDSFSEDDCEAFSSADVSFVSKETGSQETVEDAAESAPESETRKDHHEGKTREGKESATQEIPDVTETSLSGRSAGGSGRVSYLGNGTDDGLASRSPRLSGRFKLRRGGSGKSLEIAEEYIARKFAASSQDGSLTSPKRSVVRSLSSESGPGLSLATREKLVHSGFRSSLTGDDDDNGMDSMSKSDNVSSTRRRFDNLSSLASRRSTRDDSMCTSDNVPRTRRRVNALSTSEHGKLTNRRDIMRKAYSARLLDSVNNHLLEEYDKIVGMDDACSLPGMQRSTSDVVSSKSAHFPKPVTLQRASSARVSSPARGKKAHAIFNPHTDRGPPNIEPTSGGDADTALAISSEPLSPRRARNVRVGPGMFHSPRRHASTGSPGASVPQKVNLGTSPSKPQSPRRSTSGLIRNARTGLSAIPDICSPGPTPSRSGGASSSQESKESSTQPNSNRGIWGLRKAVSSRSVKTSTHDAPFFSTQRFLNPGGERRGSPVRSKSSSSSIANRRTMGMQRKATSSRDILSSSKDTSLRVGGSQSSQPQSVGQRDFVGALANQRVLGLRKAASSREILSPKKEKIQPDGLGLAGASLAAPLTPSRRAVGMRKAVSAREVTSPTKTKLELAGAEQSGSLAVPLSPNRRAMGMRKAVSAREVTSPGKERSLLSSSKSRGPGGDMRASPTRSPSGHSSANRRMLMRKAVSTREIGRKRMEIRNRIGDLFEKYDAIVESSQEFVL